MTTTLIHRRTALAIILTVQLMLAMDFLIVIVSLKNIQTDLRFTTTNLSWIPNAFALAFGGLLLLGGRLGDIMGQVKAFQVGLAIFVLASLSGGIAQSPSTLIIARIFQGIGSALAAPSVLALITILARNEDEKNRGLSLFVAVSSIGASLGLIIGGALTAFISWRWSLLINVPVGAIAFAAIAFLVPETAKVNGKIDLLGALTATAGSSALVFGFISGGEYGWLSLITAGSFISAAFLFILFIRIESKVTAPLLKLNILAPTTRRGGLFVMAVICGMHFATLFLILQYFQEVLGYNPLLAGVAYLPLTTIVFILSNFVPRLLSIFGSRTLLVTGSLLVAASLLGFSELSSTSNYSIGVLVPLVLHSIGIALVFSPGSIVILEGIKDEDAGIASGVLQISQQIGGAIGIAAVLSVYSANVKPHDFSSGLSTAFLTAAGIALIAALIATFTIPKKQVTLHYTSQKL
ncbi:Major Facilitator Superfamily protein [Pedobacter westerhofensis]|uniref:Major Facilitator Superfamily protein n=1 Tax=Pedobacter westerhofensis TaxID=425512 RepID=A0A521CYV7_9SPHI|nr:MFS transporter [Pedobacter westerhofensis]SMO64613.1 Major Facilitator Superfamily protein [Pedobacter westerhofensis]